MKVKMKQILTMLAVLTTAAASAQDLSVTVTGKVTDAATNEPVPYASVHLEGTTIGISTDGEGIYSITVPTDGYLVFSSMEPRQKGPLPVPLR